jgi:hypothetical protein
VWSRLRQGTAVHLSTARAAALSHSAGRAPRRPPRHPGLRRPAHPRPADRPARGADRGRGGTSAGGPGHPGGAAGSLGLVAQPRCARLCAADRAARSSARPDGSARPGSGPGSAEPAGVRPMPADGTPTADDIASALTLRCSTEEAA